jgi:hypothetical protein
LTSTKVRLPGSGAVANGATATEEVIVSVDSSPTSTGSVRPARVVATWRYVLAATVVAAVAAIVVNWVVMLAGTAAGASFVLDDRGAPHVVRAVDVVVATWPMVAGVLLAALLGRVRAWLLRAGQVVGGLLALLSVAGPMLATTDSGTRMALALMHVVVGVAAVAALEAVRRRGRAVR